VNNTAPTLGLGGPASIVLGNLYTLAFSATDPGNDNVNQVTSTGRWLGGGDLFLCWQREDPESDAYLRISGELRRVVLSATMRMGRITRTRPFR